MEDTWWLAVDMTATEADVLLGLVDVIGGFFWRENRERR